MGYTLEKFAADCRAALLKDPGPAGRELVRQYTAKASSDPEFVAKYLGSEANADRNILYQIPTYTSASSPTCIAVRRTARLTTTVRVGRCIAK